MGAEIVKSHYDKQDFSKFFNQLKKETLLLKQWCLDGRMSDEGYSLGVELEGWLTDRNARPMAMNQEILEHLNHPQVVPELSQFNVEINGSPMGVSPSVLNDLATDLNHLVKKTRTAAQRFDAELMMIGVLPTVTESMLNPNVMTPFERYKALNDYMSSVAKRKSHLHITGDSDELRLDRGDIMMASATTSFQIQVKVPYSKIRRSYNASKVLSPAVVALSANAPYLFGRSLWDESRIPLFEHAVDSCPSQERYNGKFRASFGTNYLNNCISDYFVENLQDYPILLPEPYDSMTAELKHLALHNGTIWRWNRIVVGAEPCGQPHVRIEHRSPSSGPTVTDSMATMAFFVGCLVELSDQITPIEDAIPFDLSRKNFYQCARKGLDAELFWKGGKRLHCKDLIINKLLPMAKLGLEKLNVDSSDIRHYLEDIILPRVQTGQNGANWQKSYTKEHGRHFNEMSMAYLERQKTDEPVHTWNW